ncbi:purine and uridine phosphorylase [Xylariaceae sp. FL1019]|nr:purine and uridine phosphorylase [Xylariaceae sp. FL1019]
MLVSAPHDRSDIKIAIICALRVEADAVHRALDRCWDDEGHKYGKAEHDTNFYTVGSVGQHNVVVVRLSGMGTIRSTDAASNIRHSFPNIQLALVVGVCGAVPTPPGQDIYLGDLVISSRVIQYNFGRQYPKGFQRKSAVDDNLAGASRQVLNFLSFLEQERNNRKIRADLRSSLLELEDRKTALPYPGAEHDHLYDPAFIHKHNIRGTCAVCDMDGNIDCELAIKQTCQELGCSSAGCIVRYGRTAHSDDQQLKHMPEIHIGHVGTADTVMKSAQHRNQIASNDAVIAFEMEGSGVSDQFPAIVVKGVCDYADSHKSKDWQPYAALIAALGTKALLNLWTPTVPDRITKVLSSSGYAPDNSRSDLTNSRTS